jgi:hypothetical protein
MWRSLLFVATVVALGALVYKEDWEFFQAERIRFLSQADVQAFLMEDKDRYVMSMTHLDLIARGVKLHKEYLVRAGGAAREFTEAQKERLERMVERAEKVLQQVEHPIVKYEVIPWVFALVSLEYENGLPHTRQDTIFLFPAHLELEDDALLELLLHEWVHLYQRKNLAEVQERLYEKGYQRWRERRGYPRIRANPDVDSYIYVNPLGEVMVSVYSSDRPVSIGDVVSANALGEHPFEEMAYQVAA